MSATSTISQGAYRARYVAVCCGVLVTPLLLFAGRVAAVPPGPVVTMSTAPLSSGALSASQDAALNAVSCTGLNTCVAVGSFRTAAGNQLLIANELNGAWISGPRLALPHDAQWSWAHAPSPLTQLSSLACPSFGNCVAVGTYLTSSGFEPLIGIESSGVWASALRVTLPANATSSQQAGELFSISCTSIGNCQAVGTYSDVSGGQLPLVVEENAGVWSSGFEPALPVGAVSRADQQAQLSSISCWSAGNCAAVGAFVNGQGFETMVLNETNAKWTVSSGAVTISLPASATSTPTAYGNALNAISCPSALKCIAVGDYLSTSAYVAMATSGSGSNWTVAVGLSTPTLPAPSGEIDASLNALDCVSTTWCVGLGAYGTSTTHSPMTAIFSATTFGNPVLGATPSDGATGTLATNAGAACFAISDCVVVGSYATMAHGTQGFVGTPTTVPGAPTGVGGVSGNQMVHLQWSAPIYNGGLTITGYVVSASPGSATCTTTTATSCTLGSLTNGVDYRFRVVAQNSLGASALSSASGPLTPRTVPSAPSIKSVTALAGALKLSLLAPTNNGGAVVVNYQYSITGGATWRARSAGTTSSTLTITGLARHRSYRVALRALNAVGPSPASKVVKATTR